MSVNCKDCFDSHCVNRWKNQEVNCPAHLDKWEKLGNWLGERGCIVFKADDRRDFQMTYWDDTMWEVVAQYPWKDLEEYMKRDNAVIGLYEMEYGACNIYYSRWEEK